MGGGGSKAKDETDYGVEIGSFKGTYLGSVSVLQAAGVEACQEAVVRTIELKLPERPVIIRITTVGVFLIDAKTKDALKEVATANVSFVSMDPRSNQIISFFEQDLELRLTACHTFRIPKDAHQLPICINESFKILTGQVAPPEAGKNMKLQRKMSKSEALRESQERPAILKGALLDTYTCMYVGTVGVAAAKGDDVVAEASGRIMKLNADHNVQLVASEIRIYENVFAVTEVATDQDIVWGHIRDVTFAKLSPDAKVFCFILYDKRSQVYECTMVNVPVLAEDRPSIRRSIDAAQKKNIAAAKAEVATENQAASAQEAEAETGKILGTTEALLLGSVIVDSGKGVETCTGAYQQVVLEKKPPTGVYIQIGTESIKQMDALTHEIIENKVLKQVCFTTVLAKGAVLAYITRDDEVNLHTCFLLQFTGDRAAKTAMLFGEAFKLLTEEQKRLGANPFEGVGERLVPPADLFPIQIHRADLVADKIIGAGAFGQVYLASQKVDGGNVRRAVKMLRGGASEADRKVFIRETQFMRHMKHENLVHLVGVAMQQKPWLMVLEYCQFGDLKGLLSGCRSRKLVLNYSEQLSLASQVAAGMQYMAERRCVHMDLAARNCLVAKGTLVKVADFGLSRTLPPGQDYWRSDQVLRLPIKWTAIESLDERIFSEASDVWSYGVLLWEITSNAAMPYADLKAQEVQRKVREGLRLPKQKTTPDELHQLCLSCWNHVRTERLSFAEIARMLVKMMAKDMETNHNTVRDISAELVRPSTSGGERRQSVSQRN